MVVTELLRVAGRNQPTEADQTGRRRGRSAEAAEHHRARAEAPPVGLRPSRLYCNSARPWCLQHNVLLEEPVAAQTPTAAGDKRASGTSSEIMVLPGWSDEPEEGSPRSRFKRQDRPIGSF